MFRAADGECKRCGKSGQALAVGPREGWRSVSLSYRAEAGAVSRSAGAAAPWRAAGAGQHHGQRPATARTAGCSFTGAPSRASQGFGLLLLRPHPQEALDLGLGALCQFS